MAMECVFQVHDWIYWSGKFDLYEHNFGPVLHLCARFIRSGLHNLIIQIHVNLQISSTNFKFKFILMKIIKLYASLPWNQETPLGYVGYVGFNFLVVESYLIFNGTILLLFVSLCLHHRGFYEMFRHALGQLECPEPNRNDKHKLHKLIQFHYLVKG